MGERTKRRRLVAALCLAAAVIAATPAAHALDDLDVAIGRALFKRPWVPGPASTQADDGLGPLYDARSCASCHPRDGRAAAAFDEKGQVAGRGMVLMIGQKDGTGDPIYGRRLQIDAVPGLKAEGIIAADDMQMPDGRIARRPRIDAPGYGPLDEKSGLSLRAAPDLRGRGAMAQVPDAAILAVEAEQATGRDGVRGRARRIAMPDGTTAIGRFGWKASHADITHQSAEAFFLDLGLSTSLYPAPWGDCTPAQTACRAAPHGNRAILPGSPKAESTETAFGPPEISDALLNRVVAYVASLPVPAPAEKTLPKGARLFASTGCAQCHRPSLPTKDGRTAQLFTDLLIHGMGPDLGDTMPEPGAGASDWRTAPLAGISEALARDTGLLHDGRARTVEDAVRWHGGEAATAAARFGRLSASDREALVRYVSSL